MSLLEIEGLSVSFATRRGEVRVLKEVDLKVNEEEGLAVVGETGCGKTVLARTIVRLLPGTAKVRGSMRWRGMDLMSMDKEGMRALRGREIALLMQSPSSCLDPTMRVLGQVSEPYRLRRGMEEGEARKAALEALARAGLPAGKERAYPHELSGGMRQRVALALALAQEPALLIADEPTKGLDEESRNQAVQLLGRAFSREGRTGIVITHDLETAERLAPRMAVMFEGRVVEYGLTRELMKEPQHPYTRDLVASLPGRGFGGERRLTSSEGKEGCCYSHRCGQVHDRCCVEPSMRHLDHEHECRCWLKEGE